MNTSIEQTIDRIEQLYTTITGHAPPHVNGNGAPIPPETDAVRHVEENLAKLLAALSAPTPAAPAMQWVPRATTWRDEGGVYLAIDVPGVTRESLRVELSGRTLVVTGERPAPATAFDACETPHGTFARSFELAARVEPDQISARLDAGVLRLRVACTQLGEPSPIPISL